MDIRLRRVVVVVAVVALLALGKTAMDRPIATQVKLKAFSVEASGLYDKTGAELPFVSLRLSIPKLDHDGIEFCRDPFEVECKVRDRWVKIENRAGVSGSIQNEISFLILPGTDRCRLHFRYHTEMFRWRLLRAVLPWERFHQDFSNRFSKWFWLKSPIAPQMTELMYQRDHFRRPPRWSEIDTEIEIPRHP